MPLNPTRGPTGPQGIQGVIGPVGGYAALNTTAYGAVGNDVANDTAALQAAINAAIAQKAPLFLAAGTYRITAPLTINGPITIIGAGRRLSTIHLASTTLNAIEIAINVLNASDYGQLHFSNFGVVGDGSAPTAGDLVNIQTISANPVEAPLFRDMWFQNGWNGIHVVSGATYTIDACQFYGQWNDGIVLEDTANTDHGDGRITGCFFLGRNVVVGNAAVRFKSGGGVRFTDNIVTVYDYGFYVILDTSVATSELFIANNRINGVDIAAIKIGKGTGTSFNNVTITGNKLQSLARCLDLSDTNTGWLTDVAVTGNVFNTLVGGTPVCVDIAAATNFSLVGNTFKTWGGTTPIAISIGVNASGFVGNNQIGSGFSTNIANASANVIVISPLSGNVAITGNMTLSGGLIASGAGEFRTSGLAGTVLTLTRIGNDAFGSFLKWVKNRNASPFSHTTVQSGDELGYFSWQGDDGTQAIEAVRMVGIVDGTPGTNDMPGRWELWTTPDGAAAVVRRLYITNAGDIIMNPDSLASSLRVNGDTVADLLMVDGPNDAVKIGGGTGIKKVLSATTTFDPPSIADNAITGTTVTVTGAATGDPAIASLSTMTGNWTISAYVSSANTVTVILTNRTGGAVDLGSGTLRATVFKF